MYCKKCGGKVESYASHCPFCGEALANNNVQSTYTTSIPAQHTHTHKNVGKWILTYFLLCLPVANIILLFVWAFGGKTKSDLTFRSWARTSLLLIAIIMTISLLYTMAILL